MHPFSGQSTYFSEMLMTCSFSPTKVLKIVVVVSVRGLKGGGTRGRGWLYDGTDFNIE